VRALVARLAAHQDQALGRGERGRLGRGRDHTGRRRQFFTHRCLEAEVGDGLQPELFAVVVVFAVDAHQHEPVAHDRDHGVRAVPRRGARADHHKAALPCEGFAAVGADVALVAAVVNFA
jgi:hypothetical protein